ncbi:MAG TPA: hypothetical protein VGS18_02615, partial [Thermoplasmata archaeon]|nr:hypothetical protein [Thermoplasmata archaeon]
MSVEPPPTLPGTTPVVVNVLSGSSSKTTSFFSENFTAPSGTWALIVVNYTGSVVSAVYDSSYRLYIDQSLVLLGTSPEYGTWNVLKDLTPYT